MLLVILRAVVGPSSAILMLPSIDYWEFNISHLFGSGITIDDYHFPPPHGLKFALDDVRLFVEANESTLWPDHISISNHSLTNCTAVNGFIPEYCPSGGLSAILGLANPALDVVKWNLTIAHNYENTRSYNRFLEGNSSSQNPGGQLTGLSFYFTQTTPLFADDFLLSINYQFDSLQTSRLELTLSNVNYIPAPVVYVYCNSSFYQWQNDSQYEIHLPVLLGEELVPLSQLTFPLLDGTNNWSTSASVLLDVWN